MDYKKNLITVKPIKGGRTTLGQAADECFKDFPLLAQTIKNGEKN